MEIAEVHRIAANHIPAAFPLDKNASSCNSNTVLDQ